MANTNRGLLFCDCFSIFSSVINNRIKSTGAPCSRAQTSGVFPALSVAFKSTPANNSLSNVPSSFRKRSHFLWRIRVDINGSSVPAIFWFKIVLSIETEDNWLFCDESDLNVKSYVNIISKISDRPSFIRNDSNVSLPIFWFKSICRSFNKQVTIFQSSFFPVLFARSIANTIGVLPFPSGTSIIFELVKPAISLAVHSPLIANVKIVSITFPLSSIISFWLFSLIRWTKDPFTANA